MLGQHQLENAALAVAACRLLDLPADSVDELAIRRGLQNATLPGRIEIVSRRPAVVMDIAHNVASVNALVDELPRHPDLWQKPGRRILVFAASRDKDLSGMLKPSVSGFDTIVFCRFTKNPRSADPAKLADLASPWTDGKSVLIAESPSDALHQIGELAEEDLLVVTGSAFIVSELSGPIRESLRRCNTNQ